MKIINATDINARKKKMHFYSPKERLESWEICHGEFLRAREQREQLNDRVLALHLMGFLSSWGMYCRKAPLFLKHHYLIHEKLIEILMNKKYAPLFLIKNNLDFKRNIDLMCDAFNEISRYYRNYDVLHTTTLTSKVMLGVYGCVPAFDTKVNAALSEIQCKNSTVFKKKIELLAEYIDHNPALDSYVKNELSTHPNYTYMRILDEFLWHF